MNDGYVFPEVLDLTKFMAEDADKSIPPIFYLYGVLVHSGVADRNRGHHYSFVCPNTESEWFRFDNDRVTHTSISQIMLESFGGEQGFNESKNGNR